MMQFLEDKHSWFGYASESTDLGENKGSKAEESHWINLS